METRPNFEHVVRIGQRCAEVLSNYAKFIGPGVIVGVAYIDPGNYSTGIAAGSMFEYKLLFVILMSNIFAVILQVLCARLGAVTGLNLAENCREHLPKWLNYTLYILTEIAIIATDLAEVVGMAISLDILFGVPLTLGVLITVIDVLFVLLAYNPNGPIKFVRYFEYFVTVLVAGVVICFGFELSAIKPHNPGDIIKGFFPSKTLLEPKAVYLSCGILGATVMPHSLYLGSGLVQPRLKEYDVQHGIITEEEAHREDIKYQPSIQSINYSMKYTIAELVISLCTVAIFVNSAILIVAGATMYHTPEAYDADIYSIYYLLVKYLGITAGTVFALALLFSGQSAGIVCTLAGQMVSEGFIAWSVTPWVRRLITRSLAIAPCLFVSATVGRKGLADVLNASQVVLSLLLPFVTLPLVYFTASPKIMRVPIDTNDSIGDFEYVQLTDGRQYKDMSNSKIMQITVIVVFVLVSVLNLYLIFSVAPR